MLLNKLINVLIDGVYLFLLLFLFYNTYFCIDNDEKYVRVCNVFCVRVYTYIYIHIFVYDD